MGDLVWVTIFFPKPLDIDFFLIILPVYDFFSMRYRPSETFFFSAGYFFPWHFHARFFRKSPLAPLQKSNGRPLKIVC